MLIGVSFKMYLDRRQTRMWCAAAAELANQHAAVRHGDLSLVVFPTLPALEIAMTACRDTPMAFGSQDLFWADRGAYTGAVSGADLADMGCRYAEIGHAERRRFFGEDDGIVAKKVVAATRNGLIPWLCVGESKPGPASEAVKFCVDQLRAALSGLAAPADFVVAYEPVWAIGQPEAASAAHVAEVVRGIKAWLTDCAGLVDTPVTYGGSAGPGTLTELSDVVDGLFLGRFAHDIQAFERLLDEAAACV